jgi:predicted alpha/beta hydrolase family esterase
MKTVKHTEVGREMLTWLEKFEKIEEKNKCLRVRFLDWLSAKLSVWSKKVKDMSNRIESPCVIKLKD